MRRYGDDTRRRPDGAPWVVVNMICSADGATTLDGRSGGLGGPADKEVFRALRAVPDVILVAAGTARDESYGPVRTPAEVQALRHERGQSPVPRLALVSASLGLDPTAPVFVDSPEPPLLYTVARAPLAARRELEQVAEVVVAGTDQVRLDAVVEDLEERGVGVVLCEGGPSLNGQLVAAELVDELCLSVSPILTGGDSPRIAQGAGAPEARLLRLDRVLLGEDLLFLRYLRR